MVTLDVTGTLKASMPFRREENNNQLLKKLKHAMESALRNAAADAFDKPHNCSIEVKIVEQGHVSLLNPGKHD